MYDKKNLFSKNTTLRKKDLELFKRLQLLPYELGGKIVLESEGRSEKVKEIRFSHGDRRSLDTHDIESGILWFHTHPSFPSVGNLTVHSKVLSQMKKRNGGFTIDIPVSPVSDTDLLLMISLLKSKRVCGMAVFCPEGIYILSNGKNDNSPKRSPGMFERSPESATLKLRNMNRLNSSAELFLKKRDKMISNDYYEFVNKTKNTSDSNKRTQLFRFQNQVGKKVKRLIDEYFPELSTQFYVWRSKEIHIHLDNCILNS